MSTERGRTGARGRRRPGRAHSRRRPDEREHSAGGVMVHGPRVVVIVPTRRDARGRRVVALPKGHVDPGETPEQAAAREVREETGLVGENVGKLGESRYIYQREGLRVAKVVDYFLFRYVSGDTADHDDEVEEVRWMRLEEAPAALTYKGDREMVERARSRLGGDR